MVPFFTRNIIKEQQAECDAVLGILRTAMRVYAVQYEQYPVQLNGMSFRTAAEINQIQSLLGIYSTDLDGRYFQHDDYSFSRVTRDAYLIRVSKSFRKHTIQRQVSEEGAVSDYS